MSEALYIFISYGRKDGRELAFRLRDDLMANGHFVWLDTEEIPGGADWSSQIEQAIEECDITLALLSHHSYQSQWCRAEQLRAIRKGKHIIPLLVQDDAEPPLHLEHMNFLNFADTTQYDRMFRALYSDIVAKQAFKRPTPNTHGKKSPYKKQRGTPKRQKSEHEKRNAPAFRRHIRALRNEDWQARFWWPYFLFHFTDVPTLAKLLTDGEIVAPYHQGDAFKSRWDKFVRLYFRPRTPDLFRSEGFRDTAHLSKYPTPMPAYLLFDLEAVMTHGDSVFSDGDPRVTKKTYKTPRSFSELPFDTIYHDSWFMPDEREEVMHYRNAQVLMPEKMSLESLQIIWMRSTAEYETLHYLLSDDVWRHWRDKITTRTDYHLFNHKWAYITHASLLADMAVLRFNPCQLKAQCSTFMAKAIIRYTDGRVFTWQDDAFTPDKELAISMPDKSAYDFEFYLDEQLAYAGHCN